MIGKLWFMNRRTLLLLIGALNFADVAATFYGLSVGGTELNPLFQPEALPIKVALPFIYALLFLASYRFCQKRGFVKGLMVLDINLAVLLVVYLLVVANNSLGIILETSNL